MRLASLLALVVLLTLTACGGSARQVVAVRIFPFPEGPGLAVVEHASGGDVPLDRVRPFIPDPLPGNPDQRCKIGAIVEVAFSDGETVDYGPCRWPRSIERLRLKVISTFRVAH